MTDKDQKPTVIRSENKFHLMLKECFRHKIATFFFTKVRPVIQNAIQTSFEAGVLCRGVNHSSGKEIGNLLGLKPEISLKNEKSRALNVEVILPLVLCS